MVFGVGMKFWKMLALSTYAARKDTKLDTGWVKMTLERDLNSKILIPNNYIIVGYTNTAY